MTLLQQISYNQVPYPNLSHYSTHPDCIATLALLLGLSPAPIENCRVLELGSAGGGNIIPMAYIFPGSEFIGIDISEVQIAAGQKKIQDLGLKNINLLHLDIMDVADRLGKFDYIVAHGVFSWVPEAVQNKILDIYRCHLTENGVGFISYNAYPGWHLINIARDIMGYYTRDITDPLERSKKAREALRFHAAADPQEKGGYFGFLKMFSDYIDGNINDGVPKYDSALLHDELSELNQPFYLHEFVRRTEDHDLQYLGDLQISKTDWVAADVLAALQKDSTSLVDLEQKTDFLTNQTFRKTLVCHKEIKINRKVKPEQAKKFFIASHARPVAEDAQIHTRSIVEFQSAEKFSLKMDHPLSKAAMICLADAWPGFLSFDELAERAQAWLEKDGEKIEVTPLDLQVLGANLLRAFAYHPSLVELHAYRSKLTTRVSECPLGSKTARYDLEREESVTNLRHERVVLSEMERFIFPYLDGTRTREDLLNILMEGPVAHGTLTLERKGELLPVSEQKDALAGDLEHSLQWLAQAGLLVDTSASGGVINGI